MSAERRPLPRLGRRRWPRDRAHFIIEERELFLMSRLWWSRARTGCDHVYVTELDQDPRGA